MNKHIVMVLSIFVISILYIRYAIIKNAIPISNLQVLQRVNSSQQIEGKYYLNARIIVGSASNLHLKVKAKEAGLESPIVTVENN